MIELQPCPFCGHAARLWTNSNGVFVRCTNPNCEVSTLLKEGTFGHDNWLDTIGHDNWLDTIGHDNWLDTRSMAAIDQAVKLWNRRADNG